MSPTAKAALYALAVTIEGGLFLWAVQGIRRDRWLGYRWRSLLRKLALASFFGALACFYAVMAFLWATKR